MALHFHLGFLLFLFALAISGVASAPVLHRKAGHAICNESTWAISGYVDEGTTPCAATSASIVQTKRPYFSRDRSSTSIGTALDTPDSRGVSDDMLATSQTAKLSLHRRGFLDNIGNAFKSTFNKVKDGVKNVAQKATQGVKNVANKATNAVKHVVNKAQNGIKKATNAVKHVVNKAKNTVKHVVNKAKNAVKHVVNNVKKGVKHVVNNVKKGVKQVVNNVKKGVKHVINNVKKGVKHVVNNVKKGVNKVTNAVKHVVNKAQNAVKHVVNKVQKGVQNVIQKTKDGINKGVGWIKKNGAQVGKFALAIHSAGASVASRVVKFIPIPGVNKAASMALQMASMASGLAADAIPVQDMDPKLQQGMNIMGMIKNPLGAAAEHVKGPGGQVLGALNTVMDIV